MNKRTAWTFAITSVALFMVTLDNLVVTTAIPVIRAHLHASLPGLEWTVNAYTLTFAVLLLTGAALGDRFGRRRLFTSGLAVALGPVVGGAIAQALSWQWIFWLNVPIGAALVALAPFRLAETRGPAGRLDLRGLGLSATGRTLIGTGLALQAAGLAWLGLTIAPATTYPAIIGPFLLAGAGMGLFFAPMANVVLSSVRPAQHGQASGANNAIRELGGVLGVAVLATIFSSLGGYRTGHAFVAGMNPALLIGAAVVAAGAAAALFIPRGQSIAPSEATSAQAPTFERVDA